VSLDSEDENLYPNLSLDEEHLDRRRQQQDQVVHVKTQELHDVLKEEAAHKKEWTRQRQEKA
jgi:hypothetical protein